MKKRYEKLAILSAAVAVSFAIASVVEWSFGNKDDLLFGFVLITLSFTLLTTAFFIIARKDGVARKSLLSLMNMCATWTAGFCVLGIVELSGLNEILGLSPSLWVSTMCFALVLSALATVSALSATVRYKPTA